MIEMDAWLTYCELNKGFSAGTICNYRRALIHFAAWLLEMKLEPQQATAETLQRYAGEILHSRGQSPSTRRIVVSALRGYYRWLEHRKKIGSNPAKYLPFPKMGTSLPLPIPADDASRLLAKPDLTTFKGVRDLAILSVLLGCGPRVSGVTGMNDTDLIFTKNDQGMEELTIRLREKGKHERMVPAPEETRLMLRAYLGHPELETIDRRLPDGNQVLFVNLFNSWHAAHERRGEARRLGEGSIYDMIQGYGRAAGINERLLHPHAFRHLYGQELAEGNVDLVERMQLMGHRHVKSAEIYSHIAFRKLRVEAMRANPMKRVNHPARGLADKLRTAAG